MATCLNKEQLAEMLLQLIKEDKESICVKCRCAEEDKYWGYCDCDNDV